MELLLSLCYYLFPFLAFLVVYLSIHYSSNPQKRTPTADGTFPCLPGERGWPVIGESLEYFTELKKEVPENFVAKRFGKYSSKVFKTSMMGEQITMLKGVEGNKFLFSSEGKTIKNWVPEFIAKIFVFTSQQAFHESTPLMHKIVKHNFKADRLHGYVPLLDSIMKKQLKTNWNAKKIHVSQVVSRYTSTYSCLLFISIEDDQEIELLFKQMKDIIVGTTSMAIDFPGTAFHKAVRASRKVRKQFEEMIKQRNIIGNSGKNDILSQLLLANQENQQLAESNISSIIVGLIHASTSPIDSVLASMMMYLAEFPDVYAKVLKGHKTLNTALFSQTCPHFPWKIEQMEIARSKDPKSCLNWEDINKMRYSWSVAKEVLRLRPPTVGTFREAITDITYDRHTIPKGWKLHWMAYATHKSSDYFENPEEFLPSRFEGRGPPSYSYVPFGGGKSMCPGNEFSRLAILVFIHNVITRFRWEKPIANEKIVSDPVPRPAQGLPVLLHPHKA